jgi:GalNAc-alpha-(1->4)-GalNAc-alpha-(1->3)-diNAcBac-PP-undecaprenol alpha-1,4-N-acetyl-D-galactosaminyltransferase
VSSIVLVSATLTCGGAERQLAGMANYWAATGAQVRLVTWSGPEVPDFFALDPRVRRERFGVGAVARRWHAPLTFYRRIRALRQLLRAVRPDAVISFITVTNVLTLLASVGLGLKVAVSDRAHPATDVTVTRAWALMRRVLYRFAHVVVAQTSAAADWTLRACGKRAVVIPNALRELAPRTAPREPLVLAIGRLDPQKGFDLLLRAFAAIAARFPQWRIAILGEGPELESLRELRTRLGLEPRVSFEGNDDDIEAWMARAALVVQPSRYEGFPNVLLESMAMGAAVISADCIAGPADLIADGVNGRLVPVEQVDALAAAMADLMSQPDTRERLGAEARKVRETYRSDRIMARWSQALNLDIAAADRAGQVMA